MQKLMETTYTAAAPLASIFIRAIQATGMQDGFR
jgi:hypothetical protein